MFSTKENPLCLIHLDNVSAFMIEITAAHISGGTAYHTFFVVATAGCKVYWGDNTSSTLTTGTNTCTHTYAAAGYYLIQIAGAHTRFYHGSGSTAEKATRAIRLYSGLTSCANAFQGCSNAKFTINSGFTIPNSVQTCLEMFRGCSGNAFTVPAGFTLGASVFTTQSMFLGCSGTAFTVPSGFTCNTSSLTTCIQMFYGCSGNAFALPSGFTLGANIVYINSMFQGCSGTGFMLPSGFAIPVKVTNCSYLLYACSKITSDISNIFPTWGTVSVNISNAFSGCVLIAGTLPSAKLWDNTSVTWTSTGAFTSCTNLTNYASIPAGWK